MGRRIRQGLAALGMLVIGGIASGCASAGERIDVPTKAGYDFGDFRADPPAGPVIAGNLVLPPSGPLRGAAILSHGSGGPGGRQVRAAERLAEAGIAALVLDHFSARGVRSVVRDQLRISEQQMAADIYAARDVLATRLGLAPDRIGAIGWSKGATAVSLAAVERLGNFVSDGAPPIAFAAAFYPFCGFRLDDEALGAPLLLLLAGEDDWTPSAPCLRQAAAWADAGQPVASELYEGASHGFDSRSGRFRAERAVTVRDTSPRCTLEVDETGRTVTSDGAHSVETLETRSRFLAACGTRGVTFAGNQTARTASLKRLETFINEALP